MEMNAKLYEELLNIHYFEKCGEHIHGLYDFEVYEEKDFNKAIQSLSRTSWSNILLEEQNKLTVFFYLEIIKKTTTENGINKQKKSRRINTTDCSKT